MLAWWHRRRNRGTDSGAARVRVEPVLEPVAPAVEPDMKPDPAPHVEPMKPGAGLAAAHVELDETGRQYRVSDGSARTQPQACETATEPDIEPDMAPAVVSMESDSVATRSGGARPADTLPLQHHPVAVHARALLDWCRDDGVAAVIRAPELMEIYLEMCIWHGWADQKWNPVAAEVRRLLGGKKTYAWLRGEDGELHRLRVFKLSGRVEPRASAIEMHRPGPVSRVAGMAA